MPEQQELFFVYNKPPEDRLPNQDVMTTEEVANCLHYSAEHIRKLIDLGHLDAFDGSTNPGRIRPSWRIFTKSVRKFMQDRREGVYDDLKF